MDNYPVTRRVLTICVLAAVCCFVAVAISACCGGGSSGEDCLGEVEYMGKTYSPESGVANRVEAQKTACNVYCLNADPGYDAMYGIWVSSPRGAAAGRPPKTKAIYQDQTLMDYVTITCANKCVSDVASGALEGKVVCTKR